MTASLPYDLGTYFAVPLRSTGYGLGLVARMNGRGSVFGYFFNDMVADPNSASVPQGKRPEDAILIGKFGDLGLIEGAWLILGNDADWKARDWPMPPLVRVDEQESKAFLSEYDEYTFDCISERRCDMSVREQYPYDRLMGAGAVEIRLTALLANL